MGCSVSLRGTLNEKTKQTTTHVELSEKGLWTGVQIPPAPPDARARQYAEPFFLAFGTEALFKGEEGIQTIGEQMRVEGKR